jgi:hypothetical protein
MILRNTLPAVQAFLRPLGLTASAASLLTRLLLAFCCHTGHLSAAACANLPRLETRHKACPGRFLGRQRWAKGDWPAPLRAWLIEQTAGVSGTYFFLVDTTQFSRQGEHTANTVSTGNRLRRPRQGRRYSTKKTRAKRCHTVVFGLLLTPSGLRIPLRKSYYTKEYCAQKGYAYRTQAELAALLIDELALPAGADVVVLGDTAFEAACVRRACRRQSFAWVAPCNPERVLAGAKPRPKVRRLLDRPDALRFAAIKVHPDTDPYALQRRQSASRAGRQAKGRTYWVCRQKHAVHSVGEVLVVLSTAKKPTKGEPLAEAKILLASDVTLTARQVVQQYTLRWQIELFFKECKSHLGMGRYRFRDFTRVERWLDAAVVSYLYLEWYRWRQLEQATDAKVTEHFARQRTAGLQAAVRAAVQDDELAWLAKRLATAGGSRRLRRLLRASLPPALRPPAGKGGLDEDPAAR